jgi:polygalacturonase
MHPTRRHFLLAGASLAALSPLSPAFAATRTRAMPSPNAVINVRDYGAKGDGTTIDSAAIDRAISAASEKGGGTVFFPAGVYASYTIHLKSMVTLYLDRGATLLAASTPQEGTKSGGYDAAEPQDPAIEAFQDFGHNHWRNSLIYGEGLHDVAILGDGLIWGRGLSHGRKSLDPGMPAAESPGVGNKAIALKNCHNVQIRDISMLKCGHFALLATGVDNLTIDNLTVDTDRDGFDIDCCKNVRVSNCTVNSPFDDGICPKSSFALGYARATENVTISDCYVTGNYVVGSVIDGSLKKYPAGQAYRTGRIKCGTESNGGFKNITITNCVFEDCQGIALETVDGALLEDIAITNITMRGCTSAPLFLRLGRRMRGPKEAPVGVLKRVLISNITSSGASPLPSILAGVDGHYVEDVKISDVFFSQVGGGDAAMAAINPPANEAMYPEPKMFGALPASGFFIRHARNLEMSHVEIVTERPDARPAFWMQDVDGFDASFLKLPAGAPYFRLDAVQGFRSFGSRMVPDKRFEGRTTASF